VRELREVDDATFNRGFPRFTHFPHPRLEILLPLGLPLMCQNLLF